jgi:chromosome segregation ATPase
MEEKIAKLQAATDEAEENLKVCKQALDMAEQQLADVKARYQELPREEQEKLQVNDTELPELIETQIRAKHLYETVQARYNTNKRYLDAFKAKMGA